MTALWRILFLVVTFWMATPVEGQDRPADHVILISIDGFRPDFYRDVSWPAPFLQHLAKNGVSIDGVRGVFPSVTYPSHTTMITGAMPGTHGVYYNSPFEEGGQTGKWYWYEKDIKVPNLWDVAKEAGLTSANLFWPVSVGAPVTWNVPEIWPLGRDADFFAFMPEQVSPAGLWDELQEKAVGKLNNTTYGMDSLARESRTAMMAAHLFETYKPNFMTVHFILTDFTQHDYGRDSLQVRQAVANADGGVGKIWEAVKRAGVAERTALVITGDHGFVNIHTALLPNVWLYEAGLLGKGRDRGDWKAVFHTTGASAFLHLKDPGDSETLAKVKDIIAKLPQDRRKLFNLLDREMLDRWDAAPNAFLALSPKEGIDISHRIEDSDIMPASKRGNHGFLPDFEDIYTGFIGYGAGFQSGLKPKQIGMEDVAPLVAHLLGIEMQTPKGTLHRGFFD